MTGMRLFYKNRFRLQKCYTAPYPGLAHLFPTNSLIEVTSTEMHQRLP